MSRIAMFVLAWLAASPAAMAADVPERFAFSAPVTVAADGSVQLGAIEGFQGRLAEVVGAALEDVPFVPATRDGASVASTVLVDGEAVLVPAGDGFELAIEGLETQPRLLEWRPADYTRKMMRQRESGSIALRLEVGADGRVRNTTVTHGKSEAMIETARLAVADWQFQPPVDGQGFEVGAAFWFHGSWEDAVVPDIPCGVQPQAAHLPGEDGCIRISETTASIGTPSGIPSVPRLVRTPAPPSAGGHRMTRE